MTSTAFEGERRHTLELTVDADSLEDVQQALRQFALNISLQSGLAPGDGLSAGWSYSWRYRHIERPEWNGDRYRDALEKWRLDREEPTS